MTDRGRPSSMVVNRDRRWSINQRSAAGVAYYVVYINYSTINVCFEIVSYKEKKAKILARKKPGFDKEIYEETSYFVKNGRSR